MRNRDLETVADVSNVLLGPSGKNVTKTESGTEARCPYKRNQRCKSFKLSKIDRNSHDIGASVYDCFGKGNEIA
jgi:hypothetical protein